MKDKVPIWETHEFQMQWMRAEYESQGDWNEAQRIVNKAIKEVVPDSKLDLQGMINAGNAMLDEKEGKTMLFHNEMPIVMFGFTNGTDGEFFVERRKNAIK